MLGSFRWRGKFDMYRLLQDKLGHTLTVAWRGCVVKRCFPPFSRLMGKFYLMLARGWEKDLRRNFVSSDSPGALIAMMCHVRICRTDSAFCLKCSLSPRHNNHYYMISGSQGKGSIGKPQQCNCNGFQPPVPSLGGTPL